MEMSHLLTEEHLSPSPLPHCHASRRYLMGMRVYRCMMMDTSVRG